MQSSRDPEAEEIRRLGVRTYVCHPMIAEDMLLGTLAFGSRSRDAFTDADLTFFRTISTYVAIIKARQTAEQALRGAEDRLRLAVERPPTSASTTTTS